VAQCDGYFSYELLGINLWQWKQYWKSGAMWHNVTVKIYVGLGGRSMYRADKVYSGRE
jgi:hypothetical protein